MCGSALFVIGSRKRGVIGGDGEKLIVVIRRLRCRKCQVIHHELPDICVPYKRHCLETIEKVIAGNNEDVCCEESTLRRIRLWWSACRVYLENIIASLQRKYGALLPACPTPGELVRAAVNTSNFVHTRSAFVSGAG